MKRSSLWLTFTVVLLLISCDKSSNPTQVYDPVNFPVTTNVTNSFTYTVNASQFSDNSQNNLSFLSDSLVITLTCSNFSSGQAVVTVRDSLGGSVFSDTVRSNKTTAIAHLKATKPKTCSVASSTLSAKLVFVLVGQ